MKLADFSPEEITYLLDLAAELKAAKREGREEQKLVGKEIALIFEKDSTRTRCAFEVAAYDQGAHVTFIGPSRLAHGPQGDGRRTPPACSAACTTRSSTAASRRRRPRSSRAGPASRSTTGSPTSGTRRRSWPTSSPSASTSPKPLNEVVFCYLGDARFNMADSYLIGGAKLGMDVRIASPKSLWPRDEIVELARSTAEETGAQDHDHRRRRRGRARRRRAAHRRLGLDGRGRRGLGGADRAAHAVPGQRRDDGGDRQPGREVHALPAGVPQHGYARSARRSSRSSGWRRSR